MIILEIILGIGFLGIFIPSFAIRKYISVFLKTTRLSRSWRKRERKAYQERIRLVRSWVPELSIWIGKCYCVPSYLPEESRPLHPNKIIEKGFIDVDRLACFLGGGREYSFQAEPPPIEDIVDVYEQMSNNKIAILLKDSKCEGKCPFKVDTEIK